MHHCLLTLVFILAFFTTAFSRKPLIIFPGDNSEWYSYSDSKSGGNSENYSIDYSDSTIRWISQLKNNNIHKWPFLGISKRIFGLKKGCFSEEDTLISVISCNRNMRITIKLSTFDPVITKSNNMMSYRVLECPVNIGKEQRTIALPLKLFKVADWWKRQYGISAQDNRQFLDSICKIDFTINDPAYADQINTINIFNLEIHPQRDSSFMGLLTVSASGLILLILYLYKRSINVSTVVKDITLQLQPRKITANLSDWERVLQYLQENYSDPQISLQYVSKALAFSDSKLSHIINDRYPDGFRCLVHELRINEGKRLIKESEMNISEIAYKLGYATPNHFNREFKKRMGVSPSAFRKL